MEYSSKNSPKIILSLLLIISTISNISSSSLIEPECGYCSKPHPHIPKTPTVPTIPKVPTLPKLPPVTTPTVPTVPKVPTVPPVTIPKVPIVTPPVTGKGCPPPAATPVESCPIDTLKLGACVDLLGGLVHIGLGDPAVNECCPMISGLAEVEAAVCLCTALKIKAMNLNLYVPIALQLLLTCGKAPPPGYTCSL